jgi:hypothetical protein
MPGRRGQGSVSSNIAARQSREEHLAKFQTVASEHAKQRLNTNWELATDAKIEQKKLIAEMDATQAKHDDLLVARRKRLAQLLEGEHEMHERMLSQLVVTDEARREKLLQKARDLRAQREEERQAEAERQRDRLFREQAALIRGAESAIKVLHVADQRARQLEMKERLAQQKAEEDRVYAAQLEAQYNRQLQRQQDDMEGIYRRNKSHVASLEQQVTYHEQAKSQERERARREAQEFREKCERELREEREKEQARRRAEREIAAETKEMRKEVQQRRAAEEQQRREDEQRELDAIIAAKKREEEAEIARRRAARDAAVSHMREVEDQMNQMAESETALDRRWMEEGEREWNRRESVWRREQDRRDRMMADVFESRRSQVIANRRREEEELARKHRDHEDMERLIETNRVDDTDTRRRRLDIAQQTRQAQRDQWERRQAEKDRLRDEKRTALTAAQEEEELYRAKITSELAKLDAAKPEKFQQVSLFKRKSGLAALQNGGF